MLGTTLPTPMYALYAQRLHFGVLTTTIIFATYAAGVLTALLLFGRWSDVLGRRPLLIAGAVCSIASAIVFLTAGPVGQLLVGRVLSGLSAGIYAGAATAAVIESATPKWRARAPAIATAATTGGLALGPLLAGFLVEYAAWPLHLVFVVNLALLVPVTAALCFVPETAAVRRGVWPGVQRLAIPRDLWSLFLRAAIAGFAGFAVLGLFTAVAPSFLASVIGVGNHAVAGGIVFAVLGISTLAQIVYPGRDPGIALVLGCAVLAVGTLVIGIALAAESLVALICAAVLCGVGQGISFSRGLGAVAAATPIARRAEVTSTYFVIAYIALTLPVVGVGFAARAWGLRTAGIAFTLVVAVLPVVALVATVLANRRADRK